MFLLQLLVSLVLMVIGYLIMPKPKGPKPEEVTEMDGPTAEAGIPVPVLFGEITIKAPNFLWWGDKYYTQKSDKTSKKDGK